VRSELVRKCGDQVIFEFAPEPYDVADQTYARLR